MKISEKTYEMTPNMKGLCGIRRKKDVMMLLLECVSELNQADVLRVGHSGPTANVFRLEVGRSQRLFFSLKDKKIFSISFPFEIREKEDKYLIRDRQGHLMSAGIVSALKSMVNEEVFNLQQYDASNDLEELVLDMLDRFSDKEESSMDSFMSRDLWDILYNLMTFEPGYIRYDYDVENEDASRHPLSHIDINYSDSVSYKIGLKKRMAMPKLVELLSKDGKIRYL